MKRPDIATITFHKQVPRATPLIVVTPDAARQIVTAAGAANANGLALRIAASREADGSLDYAMGFDNVRKGDITLTLDGVDLVIAEKHRELLAGMTLDFVEYEPGDFRFIFVNPNDAAAPAPPVSDADA
jgi:iron-sulfur cluster assembly protein